MTSLATPPSKTDPDNFATRADALLVALPTFVTEANALEANVVAKEASAVAAKTAAELAETNAETAVAEAAADRVQTGLDRIATGEDRVASSASAATATTKAGEAVDSAAAAAQHEVTASEWAEKTSGPVTGSEYSAKYWAGQAQATVTGNLIYRGAWDASSSSYPPDPATGDFYKVSVGGVVATITYAANDDIIYNGAGWDKIDNQQPSQRGLIYYLGGQ